MNHHKSGLRCSYLSFKSLTKISQFHGTGTTIGDIFVSWKNWPKKHNPAIGIVHYQPLILTSLLDSKNLGSWIPALYHDAIFLHLSLSLYDRLMISNSKPCLYYRIQICMFKHMCVYTYQQLPRGANYTLRDGELTPFRNHLPPFEGPGTVDF